jgi:hypothetical protein
MSVVLRLSLIISDDKTQNLIKNLLNFGKQQNPSDFVIRLVCSIKELNKMHLYGDDNEKSEY